MGSVAPLDVYVDRAEQTISVGVREMACRLNCDSKNFDRTAENLARAAQIFASGETLRDLIENEGRQVLKAQQAGTLPLAWSAADCKTEPAADAPTATASPASQDAATPIRLFLGSDDVMVPTASPASQDAATPTRLYLGSDGVMVPMVTAEEKQKRRQKIKDKRRRRGKKAKPLPAAKPGADQKYKEFKIVAFYDETQEHRLVAGTKGDCVQAGRLMRRQAARIHFDKADEKIGNVDGSPWIRNQIKGQNLPLDALGLDFYHLAENVHKARRVIHGEEDESGKTWAGDILHAFKHEGYEPAWTKLLGWRTSLRGSKKRSAADTLLGYVSERHDMIRYPEFLKKNWQIGSGPTEATCKTLTGRLKGSGKRWDAGNAEGIMALEALRQSGLWKAYWQTLLPKAA